MERHCEEKTTLKGNTRTHTLGHKHTRKPESTVLLIQTQHIMQEGISLAQPLHMIVHAKRAYTKRWYF